jgi:signal transduction histidine kinase
MDNALRYGGSVIVGVEERGHMLAVTISDCGPGIPEADLEKVFEPFYRVERSRSRSTGGTGLGLSIAKRLTQLMDGDITVKSEVGVGSEFTFTLKKQ